MTRIIWFSAALLLAAPACDRTGSSAFLPVDERVMARCFVENWQLPAFVSTTARSPFSVLVGSRNAWTWAGSSTGGPLELPLTKLAGGGQPVDVFVISGTASTKDRLATKDDATLNRQIATRQVKGPAVDLATVAGEPGVALRMPNECLKGDDCTTPQCPPRRP